MNNLTNLLLTLYSTAVVKLNLCNIAEETKKGVVLTQLTKIIEREN